MTTNNAGGIQNVVIGTYAGDAITSGDNNVAVGFQALSQCTTGTDNTAVGYNALESVTTAQYNVAIGQSAGAEIVDGNGQNTIVGREAMRKTTNGAYNTAVGHECLYEQTSGEANTAFGRRSLYLLEDGANNTSVGYSAGDTLTSGNYNTIIGYGCDVSAVGSANQLVAGYQVTGNADNSFVFGNGSTDSAIAFGATSISAPSDIRLKQNINDDVAGLSFINDLRPVTYEWKKEKDIPEDMQAHVADSEKTFNNDFVNHGFIAQEVKEVIDNHSEIKDGFKMWVEDEIDGRQRIAEGALVPMLVKSVQELSAQNADLLARIETLEG